MKSTLRLNARIFPIVGAIAFIMQIVDPSRVWVILLIGFGGTWLICRWWARGLARSVTFEREIRYGWAQVGDRLEERFTLTNRFKSVRGSLSVRVGGRWVRASSPRFWNKLNTVRFTFQGSI